MSTEDEEKAIDPSQYFYRNNAYTRLTGGTAEIALVDKRDPSRTVEMEPWLGTVFQLADGQHTIEQLIDFMTTSYHGNPPEGLERTILSVVSRLVESGTVLLGNTPKTLPYHLARPIEELDPEQARQLLREDGYYVPASTM